MRVLGLTALFLLTACEADPADDAVTTDAAKPFAVQDNVESRRADRSPDAPTAPTFALMPDGLTVTHGAARGRPVTVLQFGDRQDQVVATLASDLGQPTESENAECGAGPMQFADFGAVKASFQKKKFVGWVAEGGKGLRTGDGISPDTPYRFLERIGTRMVPQSTLDGEFVLEESGSGSSMGGILKDGDHVRMLFAGSNCLFR